jgi:hypothetical protein
MPEVQISDELERRRRNLPEDGNNEGIRAQVQIVGQAAAKQTKKGVRYPNSRNNRYGSEIRPAGWKDKRIWLGSFESEDEAMRAYDAALHAIGKVPIHYAYPPGYHKPILCNWKDQELVLELVKSMEGSHFDAFKREVTAKAQSASTSRALFPLVKDVVDLVLCDLPAPSPGAMDWMVPLCEEIDSEDVGEGALVLGIEMVPEDDSAMPLHQQLSGVHSSIVAPEENIMVDGG